MNRQPRTGTVASLLGGLLIVLVTGSCATTAQPGPGEGPEDELIVSTLPSEGADAAEPAPLEPPDSAVAEVTMEFDFDSLVAVIRSEASEPRARSVLPFGVTWTPHAPVEGSAIAFRLLAPRGGLVPEAVSGRFAGGTVRFGRTRRGWLGFAAVPIDTKGPQRLQLEFRFGDGSASSQAVDLEVRARKWDRTSLSVAPKYSSPPPEVQERIARERRQIREVLDHASPEFLLDGPFVSPRPFDVTAEFGQERVFNGELQSRHTGLDLRGQVGTPVRAAGRGRVALAGDFYFSGNGIFLDHGLGVYTGYFHLSEILVSEGDLVEKGDLIGRAGATGRVTGPHLHWSLWVDGTGQDAGSLLEMDVPAP